MIRFCFVILHFNEKSLKDTYECVDSIVSNVISDGYKIIIVENGSEDSSGEELNNNYSYQNKVDIVISEKNLGFAKGNNLGCEYAKRNYCPEFLIVLNNDTVIEQKDILSLIIKEYDKNFFHILGPDIIDKNGIHQNPISGNVIETNEEVEKEITATEKMLQKIQEKRISQNIKYRLIEIASMFKPLKRIWKKINIQNNRWNNYDTPLWNVPLHGSALIFSKDYLDKYGGTVFFPGTFLYGEEDILFYIVKRDKLKTRFLPEIKIFHKEDSSTNSIVNGRFEKVVFTNRHKLESLKAFRNLIEIDIKRSNEIE